MGFVPYASEKHWSNHGLNVQIVDPDIAQMEVASCFYIPRFVDESQRLWEFHFCQTLGKMVTIAVGDSAMKSLTLETRHFLRGLLHNELILHLRYR